MTRKWQQGTTMVAYRLYDDDGPALSRMQEHQEAVNLLSEPVGALCHGGAWH